MDVLPGNIKAKVRGIQSHGLDVESVQQGDRAAVNLSGVDKEKVFRGSELALPGKLKSIKKFTAHIQLASEMKKELKLAHHQFQNSNAQISSLKAQIGDKNYKNPLISRLCL